jgi:uncharacterized tellurite resistance protein B-like protein
MFVMAGVLRQLVRPQKKALNQKAMELEAAREILAEVFGIRLSEVDEMIENRFQAGNEVERRSTEAGLWPQELWVE